MIQIHVLPTLTRSLRLISHIRVLLLLQCVQDVIRYPFKQKLSKDYSTPIPTHPTLTKKFLQSYSLVVQFLGHYHQCPHNPPWSVHNLFANIPSVKEEGLSSNHRVSHQRTITQPELYEQLLPTEDDYLQGVDHQ